MTFKKLTFFALPLLIFLHLFPISQNSFAASQERSFIIGQGTFTQTPPKDSLKPRIPLLTIHAGIALTIPRVHILNHSGSDVRGTPIDLQKDLSQPTYSLLPKISAIMSYKNRYLFTSDLFIITTNENRIANKEMQFGDQLFPIGTSMNSSCDIFALNVSYIHSLSGNVNYQIGGILGLAGAYTSVSIKDVMTNESETASLLLVNPIVGIDIYGYFTPRLMFRVTTKVSVSPFKNYSYSYFSFKPFLEYHLFKNIGVGIRLDYLNLAINEFPKRIFNGEVKMDLPNISLVGVYRLFKVRK